MQDSKPKRNKQVSAQDFVVAWARSESINDVMTQTGMSRATIYVRASDLRKKGVKLDRFTRKALTQLDIAQLNSIYRKHRQSYNNGDK